jgi:hypothetical protein
VSKYVPGILIGIVVAFMTSLLFRAFIFPEGPTAYVYGVFIGAFIAYILSNLAGNRKVANASGAEKSAAMALAPPPGKALLVVYREGFVAKLAGLNLAVDGREFAQLTAPKFTSLVVSPGVHTLTCGFGGLAGPQSKKGSYDFQVAADGFAAVGIGVSMGLVQGSMKFTPVADAVALKTKLSNMPMAKAEPAEI